MSGPLRILQITDCHVSAETDAVYRGIDPRERLTSLLPAAREWAPDLLLLTGDLSEDGSVASYAWLESVLAELAAPMLALPGNHDVPETMAAHFPSTAVDDPLVHDAGGWRLILLNSARAKRIDGELGARQLQALETGLDAGMEDSPPHALVALHHQPVRVGSPWIDRYPLRDPEAFWRSLRTTDRVRAVCWGHIHQPWDDTIDGIRALAGPSSSANSLPGQPKFTPDPAGPACRWLLLQDNGSIETDILRPS